MGLTTMFVKKHSSSGVKEIEHIARIDEIMNDSSEGFRTVFKHLLEKFEYGLISEGEFRRGLNGFVNKFIKNAKEIRKLKVGDDRRRRWS